MPLVLRGRRRYRRVVANAKGWRVLRAAKVGACRCCLDPASNGSLHGHVQLHYVVAPHDGGDDVPDNLVPVCPGCRDDLRVCEPFACRALLASLSAAELGYMGRRGGADYAARRYLATAVGGA